ncbi:MAG: glutaredoxin family protein [Colwellia sp.]
MKKYNLYGSDGCHLCEQALSICLTVIDNQELNQVDIIEQDTIAHETETLVSLYGVHIPVLEKLSTNKKLFWPFSAEQVQTLT